MNTILVFTDGASKGNPGPGGYGAVIVRDGMVTEIGGGAKRTTNNEMELKAVVEALKVIGKTEGIHVYTDSKYVVEGATKWTFGWNRSGWKTKTGSDVLNMDLWKELVSLLKTVKVEWHKVPGHSGLVGNERADKIATAYAEGKTPTLYNEALEAYEHDIENVTYDEAKAEARSEARARQNQKAFSYVSSVDGEVKVHATWAECEARVKGKKAKFKKVFSKEEETALVAEWRA